MFSRRLGGASASGRALAGGIWPRARIEAGIRKRFGEVQGPHLREDYVLFGVLDGDVAFAIVLHHAPRRPDEIDQIIFYTRFEGFGADSAAAAAMNRNLHMAAVQMRDQALDVFAGVEPRGEFTEAVLNAAFDAWKRDLMIVLGMLDGSASFAAAFGFDRDEDLAALSLNAAEKRGARELFATFAGADRALGICSACSGRGKLGFIARTCDSCGGSGMVGGRSR